MKKIKIWVDEAGRGPWAGPVVAASACFNAENMPSQDFLWRVNDSKKLTEKQRDTLFDEIIAYSQEGKIFFGVWVVDNFVIDEINIRQANREAMRRSLVEILRKVSKKEENKIEVVIDGRDNYHFDELEKKPIYIVWGDGKVPEIGTASIIAKVFRDKLIQQYALLYPDLGLENHKWYGTKKHKASLQKPADITGIHRASYKPVKEVLEKKQKVLLHICCGPDATVPIMDLKKEYEVICFWYDPNIQPKREYDKRLKAFAKVCEIEWVEFIEWEYDVVNFFHRIKGMEHTPEKWEKCTECYDMRLERTALEARKLWIKYWTSTLNTSPHKDLKKMFDLGEKHSEPLPLSSTTITPFVKGKELEGKLEFLKIAFRKNGGFQRSVDYTKKHDIYRQNYCGCIYSDTFPQFGTDSWKEKKWVKWGFSW